MPVTFKNRIVVDQATVSAFLNDSDGPLLRHMMVVAEAIKVETIASLSAGFPRSFLGPRIVKRVVPGAGGPHVIVGAENVKTRPHRIDGNPVLAFHWKRIGRFVIVRSVNHPGSDFGPYLLARLDAAALRAGKATL